MADEKEVTITNTHVPDKLYGYGLQVRQMLYELLNCGIDCVVSVEKFDDVGVENGNEKIAIQTKSALSDRNPVSDRAVDLWKTLYNWLIALKEGELPLDSTIFTLVINVNKSGNIVTWLNQVCDEKESEEVYQKIRDVFTGEDGKYIEQSDSINHYIKTRLDPIPEFKLRFHQTEDGKVLVILDVYKGDETPYYYSGDGVLEAYVRVGNESVKATATELKRLVLRGKNTSYDSQNSTYKVDDYAFSKLKERYKKWTGNSFDDKDLISFGLVNEQGELTNAGALLADESPIRCSRLFCTRWNGLNKSGGAVDALDDAEYSGSVISLIENGEAFIKRNCKMKWRKTANSREEMPEYVERSYHEALVNALAHRDYLVNGSEVHIDIYDDRMEIYSPGGMPDGSMIQDRDPLTVPSTRRNPVLADVFNRLGYMERKGSGFGKIISGYEFQINYNESKKPSFRSDRYQFTVVMPNLNYDVPQDFEGNETMSESMSELERARMQIILHYLDTNKEINSSIAAKLLKVEIKTASRLLLKAEKLDILKSYGKTKNKVYFRE